MSKMEDFENAPFGATATHDNGSRAMKTDKVGRSWILQNKIYLDDEEMAHWNYTLDPPAPTTAREALDLAWELAHEVEEGQTIPAGTDYLVSRNGERPVIMRTTVDQLTSKAFGTNRRTLDPLPDPEPDWLDAPAVLANEPGTGERGVFIPTDKDTRKHWAVVFSALRYHWSELEDVTPLWPKENEK